MSRKPVEFVVPREASGVRLDRFLASAFQSESDVPSRAELQRWIEHGSVTVDGSLKKPADKLRQGMRVVVVPEPLPLTDAVPEEGIAFDVVHEDDAVLVVNKPPGLVVHPARGHRSGTLVNGLLAYGSFEVEGEGEGESDAEADHVRPGIVHRLDKGTSGLLVVARTAQAREKLKVQFADHSIDREYVAICLGDVPKATFDTLHGRHPRERLKFSSKVREGKRAVTHVTPIESFAARAATLVACRLETGRTHQIRVHLADSGTPILGDALYGKPPKIDVLRALLPDVHRALLHARVLGFDHPTTGERVRFEVEPPADFQAVVDALRAASSDKRDKSR